jgi:hypothetical protein
MNRDRRWRAVLLIGLLTALPISATAATVTLGGVAYTLRDHPRVLLDGSAGILTRAMADTGPNGRANRNNPTYKGLVTVSERTDPNLYQAPFSIALAAAVRWLADGNREALTTARTRVKDAIYWLAGSATCDSRVPYCGNGGIDYTRQYVINAVQTYSIIRSQLTPEERQTFADMILNDNGSDHNGLNPAGQGCAPQPLMTGSGALTAAGTTVTVNGGSTSQFKVGDVITSTKTTATLARVVSIADATHFEVSKPQKWTDFAFRRVPAWTKGNCGVIWLVKHHQYTPHLAPAQTSHYTADYPPTSGISENPQHNLILTAHFGFISAGVGLADDDPRAAALLQQSYDYWRARNYPWDRATATGFTMSGPAYTNERRSWFNSWIVLMLRNSLVNSPDLTDGVWLKRIAPYYYYMKDLAFQGHHGTVWSTRTTYSPLVSMLLYPEADESQYAHFWLRNVYVASSKPGDWFTVGMGGASRSYVAWFYILYNPALPLRDLSGAPKQYLFRDTDYAICVAQGLTCPPNAAFTHAVSHTGFGAADTRVVLQSAYNDTQDHAGSGNWGSVHIYKRAHLLSADGRYGGGNRTEDLVVEIGSSGWANQGAKPSYANIVRWAGANPTGVPDSGYMYGLSDFAGAYPAAANVTRAHRHLLHLKKAGLQDYVVWYDDIATAGGNTKKAYLHFYHGACHNKPACGEGAAGISWSGGENGGTVVSTQATASLTTTVLPVAGAKTVFLGRDHADGTYPGGKGYSYRAYVCPADPGNPGACNPSAQAGEWLVVNRAEIRSDAPMPRIDQPACAGSGGGCTAVAILDSAAPKVAVFARQGALLNGVTLATAFGGQAQYVITGLTPGTFDVAVDGARIATGVKVAAGDNTLAWTSGAGKVVVIRK